MIDKLLLELFWKPIINGIFSSNQKAKNKHEEPEKLPKLSFQKFTIENFKGIEKVEIDLAKNSLVLLLGLNESGKSTILKAIESFSFLNDPTADFNPHFFQSIRKKSSVGSDLSAIITADIRIEDKLKEIKAKKLANTDLSEEDMQAINSFIFHLNEKKSVTISRIFPFKNGSPKRYYYKFQTDHPFGNHKLASLLALEMVSVSPFIIYFEDFKDRIPEKIYVNQKRADSFDPIWYDIIDGLFYNTDSNFSIENVKRFHSQTNPMLDDAATVETRVNTTLNDTFTKKWKSLSGVQEIEKTELKYTHNRIAPYFTLKIKDKDGTVYSVDERSKGALWYLSFLMKTEFRSKKMRRNFGKPVFLIDEPASNLHSTAQQNMINDFRTLAEDTSIIYTTHSQYLISLDNIKNTYVIEKKEGTVLCQKWGQYINQKDAKTTYYQPLANLLNIVPNTFTIPWDKCIITEGPSDRHTLASMYRILENKNPDFVIYPGTSANHLDELISLNIGWNSKFKILLDGDDEGTKAGNRYATHFELKDEIVYLPKGNHKIEKCFTKEEKIEIRNLVLPDNEGKDFSKKEFASIWAIISENEKYDKDVKAILTPKTISLFTKLFDQLT